MKESCEFCAMFPSILCGERGGCPTWNSDRLFLSLLWRQHALMGRRGSWASMLCHCSPICPWNALKMIVKKITHSPKDRGERGRWVIHPMMADGSSIIYRPGVSERSHTRGSSSWVLNLGWCIGGSRLDPSQSSKNLSHSEDLLSLMT